MKNIISLSKFLKLFEKERKDKYSEEKEEEKSESNEDEAFDVSNIEKVSGKNIKIEKNETE
jgi:hypothetical protein